MYVWIRIDLRLSVYDYIRPIYTFARIASYVWFEQGSFHRCNTDADMSSSSANSAGVIGRGTLLTKGEVITARRCRLVLKALV